MSEEIGSQGLHVVVGGTGAIGGAVVEELARRGHRVRSIGRREGAMPAGVEQRIADVMDPQQAINAVAGASVVYQCAAPEYTHWVQEFPTLQANVADAAERAGAGSSSSRTCTCTARPTDRCSRRPRWPRRARRAASARA